MALMYHDAVNSLRSTTEFSLFHHYACELSLPILGPVPP